MTDKAIDKLRELSLEIDELYLSGKDEEAEKKLRQALKDAEKIDKAYHLFFQGETASYIEKDNDKRIFLFDQALKLRPDDYFLLRSKGAALSRKGLEDEAIQCYDKALNIKPDDYHSLRDKGVALSRKGLEDEAIQFFDKALTIKSDDCHSLRGKGVILSNKARLDEAIQFFDKALAIKPDDYHSLRGKGVTLSRKGLEDEAIEYHDKILAVKPDDYHSLRDKGVSLGQKGRLDEAIEFFNKALTIKPDDHHSLRNKAITLIRQGKRDEANLLFKKADEALLKKRDKTPKETLAPKISKIVEKRSPEESKTLPRAVKEFQIENFQCVRDTGVIEIPDDCPWIFLFGENGAGKTSILQALTIGVCGTKNAAELLENQKDCRVRVRVWEEERLRENTIRRHSGFKAWPGLDRPDYYCAYGPSRLDIQSDSSVGQETENIDPEKSLLDQRGNLRNIERWIIGERLRENSDPERRRNVLELLESLLPNVSRIELKEDYLICHENGYPARIHEISSGHKAIVATVGDILIRLFSMRPKETDPKNLQGIVAIDELDIHLHPRYQRELPRILSKALPKVQFICGTHSPFPLLEAPKGSKFFILKRDDETGFSDLHEMETPADGDYALQGWSLEEIIEDAMGFANTRSELYQRTVEAFDQALDQDDAESARKHYAVLAKMLHPRSHFRKLFRLQMAGMGE